MQVVPGLFLFTCGKVALKLFFLPNFFLTFCRVSIVLFWDGDEKSERLVPFCTCDGKRPEKEGEIKEKLFECRGSRNT